MDESPDISNNLDETCAFMFERLEGANDKLSPKDLSAELRDGLTGCVSDFVNT